MITKHTTSNVHDTAPIVHLPTPNVHDATPNVHFSKTTQKRGPISNCCPSCKRVFTRQYVLTKHMKICKGTTSSLECEFCHNVYSSRSSKSNHLRRCHAKKEAESQALVAAPSQTITNNNVYNAPVSNTTNNIQNIIVFNPDMKLLNDHISKSELHSMLRMSEFETLCRYSHKLLQRPENQCVRKTNLRSSSSMVHVGGNKWEAYSDNHVLPKIVSNIATNLGDSMERYKVAIQATLESYIEDITCDGEHGASNDTEECKRVQACYRKTLQHVKHILFNLTKDAMASIKANTTITLE